MKKLINDKSKVPSMARDDMMAALMNAWQSSDIQEVNGAKCFKDVWLTNALNGDEDLLVSARLRSLIGEEFTKFRKDHESSDPQATLKDLLKTVTRPKGVKRNEDEEKDLSYIEDE